MKKPLAIIGAAALMLTATPTATAEDGPVNNAGQGSSTDLNELVVDSLFYDIIAIPVTLSSLALSFLGVPQCGLGPAPGK
ncbi:hypothetical protein [Corynebacterium aurimucosum]|uniref:hypothetical protein n=1 Tax=Corynebacterium aurimucosum TaxID=169292 RepID=UPI000C804E51|nr:hypothetical protein [Corynebacterium aurimucosum]PMC68793.1 hypothetical protein CJ201_10405 [Corynebacterium aurimucosum]